MTRLASACAPSTARCGNGPRNAPGSIERCFGCWDARRCLLTVVWRPAAEAQAQLGRQGSRDLTAVWVVTGTAGVTMRSAPPRLGWMVTGTRQVRSVAREEGGQRMATMVMAASPQRRGIEWHRLLAAA